MTDSRRTAYGIARTRHPEQDSRVGTARKTQSEKESQNRTARQDKQNGPGRKGMQNKTPRKGERRHAEQDCQDRIASTGLTGLSVPACQYKAIRTGQPGQN